MKIGICGGGPAGLYFAPLLTNKSTWLNFRAAT
jgi:hypothetical protein